MFKALGIAVAVVVVLVGSLIGYRRYEAAKWQEKRAVQAAEKKAAKEKDEAEARAIGTKFFKNATSFTGGLCLGRMAEFSLKWAEVYSGKKKVQSQTAMAAGTLVTGYLGLLRSPTRRSSREMAPF